ncbi:PTS sugar transporter subunit IIA [Vibrio marisflavi]|uniref:PTS EIIA type-2 domain-containing protein n=1 Tax=Vibrio marisflavi CECT 7928 TaxID=634439 RepID=A0ABM8ZZ98_9VIBR|nr:PTS sugar transporter subunit IIA [Vibrio marisflavi]CAH0536183.1 hypothetical protein VMF7928_00261 [Vibrio marisflavi CECT 7928]
MIASRVTFYLASQGIPGWQLNEIKHLASLFRSVVVLVNITQCKRANIEHSLKILSIKNCAGDMCQLVIEGLDAELACMVFSEYFSEKHYLIATTHSQKRMTEEDIQELPVKSLKVPASWFFIEEASSCIEEVLAQAAILASTTHYDEILNALLSREKVSSTQISDRFALPHVMTPHVDEIVVITHFIDCSVQWTENKAKPELALTLLIPANKDTETLQACVRLTRWLLDSGHQQLIIDNREDFLIKEITTHIMACYQPT